MGYNFLYQDQGAPFRRAPAAARAVASCLRPGSVSARVGLATNGELYPGGKSKAMPPAGHLGEDPNSHALGAAARRKCMCTGQRRTLAIRLTASLQTPPSAIVWEPE